MSSAPSSAPIRGARAAEDADPADHGCGDGGQLQALARGHRDGPEPGQEHEARQSRQGAAQSERPQGDALDGKALLPGRVGVGAEGVDPATPAEPPQRDLEGQDHHHRNGSGPGGCRAPEAQHRPLRELHEPLGANRP